MSEMGNFFEIRKKEVNLYFDFIGKLGIDSVSNKKISLNKSKNYYISDDLKKVLKSNSIMLLYNLIEGVVAKSIEYVIDDMNDKNIKYNELKPFFKKIILKTSNKINKNDFKDINNNLVKFIDNVFEEMFYFEFTKENKKIILQGGGNIDSRFIKEKIIKSFQINFRSNEPILVQIKKDRNNLAHGSKSFSECSQDKTFREIKTYKTKVFRYLNNYVKAIEKYVEKQGYKV